jgi:hypothetical protein
MIAINLFISSIALSDSWVLWEKKEFLETSMKQNIFWNIIDAYPDYKQCLQAMKRLWQSEKNQAIQDKIKYNTISEIQEVPYKLIITTFKEPKEINSISENLYCLPGTLDPRERK